MQRICGAASEGDTPMPLPCGAVHSWGGFRENGRRRGVCGENRPHKTARSRKPQKNTPLQARGVFLLDVAGQRHPVEDFKEISSLPPMSPPPSKTYQAASRRPASRIRAAFVMLPGIRCRYVRYVSSMDLRPIHSVTSVMGMPFPSAFEAEWSAPEAARPDTCLRGRVREKPLHTPTSHRLRVVAARPAQRVTVLRGSVLLLIALHRLPHRARQGNLSELPRFAVLQLRRLVRVGAARASPFRRPHPPS